MSTTEDVDTGGDEVEDGDQIKADDEDEAKDDATEDVKRSSNKSDPGESPRGSAKDGKEKKSETGRRSSGQGKKSGTGRKSSGQGKTSSTDETRRKRSTAEKGTGSKVDAADKTSFSTGESIIVGESESKPTPSGTAKASETETGRQKSSPRSSNYSDMEDSPKDTDARASQLDTDTRKTQVSKDNDRQARRYSAKSAEPQTMIVGRIRKEGQQAYAENRRKMMQGESAADSISQDVEGRQHLAPLSLHTMEELSQKPPSYLPTSTGDVRARRMDQRSFGSRMTEAEELRLGGTRMSTLTDFLRRKQMGSRMRAMSREMQALRDQVHADGRPTLYEEYSKLSDQRLYDLSQHFTPEQIMEYRDAFYNFDDDLDGFIPIGEVPYLMRALCENPTEEELYEWISEVDIDSLGSIDFADFLTVMYKKREHNPIGYDEVLKAFKVFDNHNNGLLCAKELVYLMTTFGETLSEEEMEDMLREVNVNDDYEVPYEEFVKKMTEC